MNQKLELIKHKAEVNNLKIETNLFQRTNEVHACTRKYILLVEILPVHIYWSVIIWVKSWLPKIARVMGEYR